MTELGTQQTTGGAAVAIENSSNMVALSLLDESPINPRKNFNQAKLAELAQSIRANGIIQPIVVRPSPKLGRWEIVAGARRFRGAKLAGQLNVPVRKVDMTDVQVREVQLIENDQREDVGEVERAQGYRDLMKECGLKAPEIAKRIGQSVETVYARMKILDATPAVQESVVKGVLTAGHAVLLARLDAKQQERGLKACVGDGRGEVMSVRELGNWIEYEVRRQKRREELKSRPPVKRQASSPARDWQAENRKREEAQAKERAIRRAILDAALEKVKAPLERVDLEFAIEGFLARARYDQERDGETDVTSMKPQRLAHLLIELSILDELNAWNKPERLLELAKRYKVNVDRVRKQAEIELKNAAKVEPQTAAKAGAR